MKTEALVGGIVREAHVPPLRPLDSEFRRKDEFGGRECRSGVVEMDVGGGIAVGILSRDVSAWIPAFAGKTNSGGRNVENAD